MGRKGRGRQGVWVQCDSVLRTSTSVSSLLNLAGDLARADLFVRFLSAASDFRPTQEAARKAASWRPLFWARKLRTKLKRGIMSVVKGVDRKVH